MFSCSMTAVGHDNDLALSLSVGYRMAYPDRYIPTISERQSSNKAHGANNIHESRVIIFTMHF